jgi:hypothetical protein
MTGRSGERCVSYDQTDISGSGLPECVWPSRCLKGGCKVGGKNTTSESNNEALQELRELGYDGIADEIAKGLKKWDDRFVFRDASVAECYVDDRIGIELRMIAGVRGQDCPAQEYCIALNYAGIQDPIGIVHSDSIVSGTNLGQSPSIKSRYRHADHYGAVLVDPIKLMELPEWMRSIAAPSVVRLESANSGSRDPGEAAYFPGQIAIEIQSVVEDGKLGRRDRRIRHWLGSARPESHREMIERGSQIKEAVANQNADSAGNIRSIGDAESPVLSIFRNGKRWGFWVWLDHNSVGIGFDPLSNLVIEAIEMFVRPLKL